jgi:hypothetical protein
MGFRMIPLLPCPFRLKYSGFLADPKPTVNSFQLEGL